MATFNTTDIVYTRGGNFDPFDSDPTNAFKLDVDHTYRLLNNGEYFILYDLTTRTQRILSDFSTGDPLDPNSDGIFVDFSDVSTNVIVDGGSARDGLIGPAGGARGTLRGRGGDDILVGGSNALLDGGGGDDQLFATLSGSGHVTIDGGDGIDLAGMTLYGGNDAVFSLDGDGAGGATLSEANSDTPDVTLQDVEAYQLVITENQIVFIGALGGGSPFGAVVLVEGDTADNYVVAQGADAETAIVFAGGAGDDTYLAGAGVDVIRFGDGGVDVVANFSTYTRSASGVTVDTGEARDDTGGTDTYDTSAGAIERVDTFGGDDTVFAGDNGMVIETGDGDDQVYGGSGDDLLIGDAGADLLDGGDGVDTASYATAGAGVIATLDPSVLRRAGDATGDRLISIENLVGSDFDDRLYGNSGDNSIEGGAGDDVLIGGSGADSLSGGRGNDRLIVAGSPALIEGGAGRDTLVLASGAAATFTDETFVSIERVILRDDASIDLSAVDGPGVAFRLTSASDALITEVHGTQSDDVIATGHAGDLLYGEGGDDIIKIAGATGMIDGGAGQDSVVVVAAPSALTFDDSNFTGVERLTLASGLSIDLSGVTGDGLRIDTDGGPDAVVITGSAGNDRIIGGAGDDTIAGAGGADTMSGGDGADIFAFAKLTDMAGDAILDFTAANGAGDRIDLSAIDADPAAGGQQHFTFIGTDAFSGGGDYEVRLQANNNGTVTVQIDVNHDRVADASFIVHPSGDITAADFIL